MCIKREFLFGIFSMVAFAGTVEVFHIMSKASCLSQTDLSSIYSQRLDAEVTWRQNEFETSDYITLEYSYLDKPFSYWLVIRSDKTAQYIEYNLSQGKILAVKSGSLTLQQVDRCFKLLDEKKFYALGATYDGRKERMIAEGDIIVISASSKRRHNKVYAIESLAPLNLRSIVDTLQTIPVLLQQDGNQIIFVRAEELSGKRSKSLRERGELQFLTLSEEKLKQLPALKAALELTGFFVSTTSEERRHLSVHMKNFPYFFVRFNNREFQLRVFTSD